MKPRCVRVTSRQPCAFAQACLPCPSSLALVVSPFLALSQIQTVTFTTDPYWRNSSEVVNWSSSRLAASGRGLQIRTLTVLVSRWELLPARPADARSITRDDGLLNGKDTDALALFDPLVYRAVGPEDPPAPRPSTSRP